MVGIGSPGGRFGSTCLVLSLGTFGLLLFAGVLVVSIAGHGYQQQMFRSSTYNVSSKGFPAGFLHGSLNAKGTCDQQPIRVGDGTTQREGSTKFKVIRTNQSMFGYTVVNTGGQDIEYVGLPLQNCWVQEILVRNTKTLDTPLPAQFGFFPKAEVSHPS
jgi:hypothetical protein